MELLKKTNAIMEAMAAADKNGTPIIPDSEAQPRPNASEMKDGTSKNGSFASDSTSGYINWLIGLMGLIALLALGLFFKSRLNRDSK